VAAGITAGILAGKYGVVFIFYFAAVAAAVLTAGYLGISRVSALRTRRT
jgi:hypothetical protein